MYFVDLPKKFKTKGKKTAKKQNYKIMSFNYAHKNKSLYRYCGFKTVFMHILISDRLFYVLRYLIYSYFIFYLVHLS
jgi:hypothetical protein